MFPLTFLPRFYSARPDGGAFSLQVVGPWTERILNSCRPSARASLEVRRRLILKERSCGSPFLLLTSSFVPLRRDGGRLQRDQSGGQVYQKRRHGAGVHRRGFGHDVRILADVPCASSGRCRVCFAALRRCWLRLFLLHLCLLKATEAQQPGAVIRGDRGGAWQPLHCHRVHGQGQYLVSDHTPSSRMEYSSWKAVRQGRVKNQLFTRCILCSRGLSTKCIFPSCEKVKTNLIKKTLFFT